MDLSHRLKGAVVPTQTERIEDRARRQAVFREVNEHIAELNGDSNQTAVSLFVCECSRPECAETVEISPSEYEQVRADGTRFVVLLGHQLPEVERVVEGNHRFLVVETIGAAALIARASNPRKKVRDERDAV